MPDESSNWRTTLDDVLEPLREQLGTVEDEIAAKEHELKALRNVRGEISRVLHAAEPRQPKGQRSTRTPRKPGEGPVLQSVSPEKLDALTAYLQQFDGEAFSGPEILKRDDFNLMSDPTLRSALENLAARGVIRLDSLGGPGVNARRKNYKLVRAGK